MYRSKTAALILLPAVLVIFMRPAFCGAEFKKGDKLPDLASFKLEGPLPKLEGQVVLLDFWASWCDPCKASFPEMEKLHKAFASRGLTILAVSVDERQENMQRFVKSTNVSFPIARDAQQKLVATADVKAMPPLPELLQEQIRSVCMLLLPLIKEKNCYPNLASIKQIKAVSIFKSWKI